MSDEYDAHMDAELEDAMRDAYDPDDPKHPDFASNLIDWVDAERKRLKEEGPAA